MDTTSAPLGRIIDRMKEIRDQRKELDRESRKLKEEFDGLKSIVIERCQTEEADGARGKTASAVITQQVVAQVNDWDTFLEWVKENDAFFLFERKVKSAPFKELVDAEETPEGTEPTTVYNVSLTSL